MTEPIRGKVARVLNGQEIVINAGIVDGVTVGMAFNVMDPNGEDIKDPDTDEVLGSIERPKVRVQVIHAQEKLAVAMSPRSKGVKSDILTDLVDSAIPTLGPVARSLVVTPRKPYASSRKTSETAHALDNKDASVKIGDPVVQVIEKTE
ncbi:MAG: hypothetical protein OXU51_09195 [Candidatus Poribacteria bacterium]|nr:hypothetical protein [Candidatus Poribacteria bacterium]